MTTWWDMANLWKNKLLRGARGATMTRERTNALAVKSIPETSSARLAPEPMRHKYERTTRECLSTYDVRVRKWRRSMSGCAWEVYHSDGRIVRMIESPKPVGPMSTAIFLHEIGHHAIGFGRYKPRCLEEYYAWAWSLQEMDHRGLNITDAVRKRMRDSLRYAVDKAQRRGLKQVPPELERHFDLK